jgi:hypothetical protein
LFILGTYSLGSATRYEDFTQLPSGFNVENFADDSQQIFSNFGSNPSPTSCPKGYIRFGELFCNQLNFRVGWVVTNGEIRYQPTLCVSRLSISLHLVKDGYVELYFQLPKNRFGLMSDLVVKNEQCERFVLLCNLNQSFFFSNRASSIFSHRRQQAEEEVSSNNDWRSKRFTVRRGQNILIWTGKF